jgi:phenylpropionate dioxygenase-like ring-hydroxylating dioxygenase large terminal subunit
MTWNLPGAPWLIAHKSMLKVNKPKLFTICGQDYVLWKNDKGEISALENICPTWVQSFLMVGFVRKLIQ